jgi:hypothetical protein
MAGSVNKTKSWRRQLLVAALAPLLMGLSACGGDDDDPREIEGLVTIESPTGNPTFGPTSQATVNLSGSRSVTVNAVTWSNSAGGSGTATLTVQECVLFGVRIACNHGWSMSVSLAVGTNTITVHGTDSEGDFGQDTITITRS